jgi:hypothetical protein
MQQLNIWTRQKSRLSRFTLIGLFILGFTSSYAVAEPMSPELKTKVGEYQQKLQKWTQNPVLVNTLKQMNAKVPPKINNNKWKALGNGDPAVTTYQTSEAGKLLTDLEGDKGIGKLFLRDNKGNLVAGSKKPAIFNIADRPAYVNAMRGKTWVSDKVKADPTTRLKSVQLSAPVISEGKIIGVLHTSVIAE